LKLAETSFKRLNSRHHKVFAYSLRVSCLEAHGMPAMVNISARSALI
jgi:hypothetical protein